MNVSYRHLTTDSESAEMLPKMTDSSSLSEVLLLDPSQLWRWFAATRKLILWTLLAIALLTILVVLFYPRTYRSRAKLLLRAGRESMTLDPTAAATGQTLQLHQTRQNEIETTLGLMASRSLIEAVIDDVGAQSILDETLDLAPPSADGKDSGPVSLLRRSIGSIDPVSQREKAIRSLDQSLEFSSVRDSSVVEIEYRAADPELAQRVVQSWVSNYIANHGEFHRTSGTLEFFQQETAQIKAHLQEAQLQLLQIKDASGLATVEGQQSMLETEMGRVRSQINQVAADLASGKSRVEALSTQLQTFEPTAVIEAMSGSTESRDTMRAQLYELEVLEQDLASRYTDQHPKLIVTRRQVAEARRILTNQSDQKDQVVRGLNPIHQALETELALQRATVASLLRKDKTLQAQLMELHSEIQTLNQQSQTIATIQRDIEVYESQYLAHAERLEQARMEDVLHRQQITSVREIQPASFEQRPVSPNKLLVIAFGLASMFFAFISIPLTFGPRRVTTSRPSDRSFFAGSVSRRKHPDTVVEVAG